MTDDELVAQLFLAKCPGRVGTLLLTNCDVDKNSPPPEVYPFIEQRRKAPFVDDFILPPTERQSDSPARPKESAEPFAFTRPEDLVNETIRAFISARSSKRRSRNQNKPLHRFHRNKLPH